MKFEYNEAEYEQELKGSYRTGCFEIYMNGCFNPDISKMSTNDLGTFLHEYVHFLQNISTPWGIFSAIVKNNDLCEFVHSMNDKKEIHLPYTFTRSIEQQRRIDWFVCSSGSGHLNVKIDRAKPTSYYFVDIEGFPISMHNVIFKVQDTRGETIELKIGATIIKESMAALYQSLIDPDVQHPDVPYNIVQFLCDNHFPYIANDKRKLICLCYISLFSLDPGFALMCELKKANANPSKTGWEIFDDFIIQNVTIKGQIIRIKDFFNSLIDQYKQSLRGILPCELSYTNILLDSVKLDNGIVPILNVINTNQFGIDNIEALIKYLGIPFLHQFDGKQFYPQVLGVENSCQDIVVIVGNAIMYDYFKSPNSNYGVCPFKNICGGDDLECWGKPWLHKQCIFDCGIDSLHIRGKTIIKN